MNWQWFSALIAALLMLFFGAGCATHDVLRTGPKGADNVTDLVKTVAMGALENLQGESGLASASGSLNDPRYRAKMFFGAGTYVDVLISLEGLDLGGKLNANMKQRTESDPELRAALIGILTNTQLSERQKSERVFELLGELLNRAGPTDPPDNVGDPPPGNTEEPAAVT